MRQRVESAGLPPIGRPTGSAAALAPEPRTAGSQQVAESDRKSEEAANLFGREVVQEANSLVPGQRQAPKGEQRCRKDTGGGENIV